MGDELLLVYALLDESNPRAEAIIDTPHLQAALAVWKYCDASAARIFERATGDPVADEIHRILQHASAGMTRSDIRNHVGHHRGVLGALAVPLHEASPSRWKRSYGIGADKEKARALAIRFYPGIQASLARKRDAGRAEALLLARWFSELHK